jgi:hypothetical protein
MSYSKIRNALNANILIERRYLLEQASSNIDEEFLAWARKQEIGVYIYPNPFDKSSNEIGLGIIVKGEEPDASKYNEYYKNITNSIKGFNIETFDKKQIYSTINAKSGEHHFFPDYWWFSNDIESKKTSEGLAIYRIFPKGSDLFTKIENLGKTNLIVYAEVSEKALTFKDARLYPFKFTNTAKWVIS